MVSVVGQRGAEARRPALARVRETLPVKRCRTEALVAGGEGFLVQEVAHVRRVGR